MNTLHHRSIHSLPDLAAVLDGYADAGVDPAFDSDLEELERQFAELRLVTGNE